MNTRTDKILGASLALAAFSFITPSHVLAQTCVTPPTCESLGYTKSESDCAGKQALKCPFDNTKVFCSENTSGDNCTNPKVGYIMYSDMSCSEDVIEGKLPIGIIVGLAPNLLISLVQTDMAYSPNPLFCASYTPGGSTGWVLPLKEYMMKIYQHRDIINKSLLKIKATTLTSDRYFIYETIGSDHYYLDFSDGRISYSHKFDAFTRCVKFWGSNTCMDISCSDYPLEICPQHGSCEPCSVSNCFFNVTKYKLTNCAAGYAQIGNDCLKICTPFNIDFYYSGTWGTSSCHKSERCYCDGVEVSSSSGSCGSDAETVKREAYEDCYRTCNRDCS